MKKKIPIGISVLVLVLYYLPFVTFAPAYTNVTISNTKEVTDFSSGYINVTVIEAKQMIDSNPSIVILDVRDQIEYNSGHIRNAKLIPLSQLEARLSELNKTNTILAYCNTSVRSSNASQLLVDNGFLHVYNMLGGITDWINAGYPTYIKYASIQEAINNANLGDIIYVSSGLYYEKLTINKPLTLVGENKNTTIINSTQTGTVIRVTADNVSISDFTILNSFCACTGYNGVLVENYQNVNITNNIIKRNGCGIQLDRTNNIIIAHNNVINNPLGINIINNSSNTFILENIVAQNYYGINLTNSDNSIVSGNTVLQNEFGVKFSNSNRCIVSSNTISSNTFGTNLANSNNNMFFHNNFVDNTYHANCSNSINIWNDGVEGNYWSYYWSYYTGVDNDHDGISDTAYIIDANNQDNKTLMGMFSSFNIPLNHYVNVISNSTIQDFTYFTSNKTIKMHVSNSSTSQTYGFCRIAIPYELMNTSNILVIIDNGSIPILYANYTLHDNETHKWIYFAYQHSTHEIDIIPEFPSITILLLTIILITLAIAKEKENFQETINHPIKTL